MEFCLANKFENGVFSNICVVGVAQTWFTVSKIKESLVCRKNKLLFVGRKKQKHDVENEVIRALLTCHHNYTDHKSNPEDGL